MKRHYISAVQWDSRTLASDTERSHFGALRGVLVVILASVLLGLRTAIPNEFVVSPADLL